MKKYLIRIAITLPIIIVSFVIQSVISLNSSSLVVTPNLLLIVTCIFGYLRGSNYGSVTGLCCGLLVDIFFGDVIGLYALIFVYMGFLSGLFRKIFHSDHIFMPMILLFAGDFLYNALVYVFRFLLRNKLDFSFYFESVIFPEMIYTTFLTFILYKLFELLNKRVLEEKQESRFSFDK